MLILLAFVKPHFVASFLRFLYSVEYFSKMGIQGVSQSI